MTKRSFIALIKALGFEKHDKNAFRSNSDKLAVVVHEDRVALVSCTSGRLCESVDFNEIIEAIIKHRAGVL